MTDVFVIMPFGVKKSIVEEHKKETIDFDSVYQLLIKPACAKAQLQVSRIDEMPNSGLISDQYLKAIFEAKIVICDVSVPNGNVYYELGIRQAISPSSTILIAHSGTILPFDISHQRVLFYELDPLNDSIIALEQALKLNAKDITENYVQKYFEKIGISSNPKTNKINFEQELNGRIDRAKNGDQLIGVWNWVKAYDALPLFSLLRLAERLGEFQQWAVSSAILEQLVEIYQNDYELYRQLGFYFRQQGGENETLALGYLEKALKINPSDPETLGMIGGIYKRQGNYEKAKEFYSKGIEISPQNLYMKVTAAAMTYLESPNQKEQAIASYELLLRTVEINNSEITDCWTEVIKAEAHFALGDIKKAQQHFLTALTLEDGVLSTKSAIGQILLLGNSGLNTTIATELNNWLSIQLNKKEKAELSTLEDTEFYNDILPVIIHLTDVHFGFLYENDKKINMHRFKEGDYSQKLSDHIKDEFSTYFKYSSKRLYLVISGDFTHTASKNEFDAALEFVKEVCDFLKIDRSRVILTPGNHDIDWKSAKIDLKNRFDNYISFLYNFYEKGLFKNLYPEIRWDLSINTDRPNPEEIMSIQLYPEDKLLIVSFNSCMYETDQDHYGFIGGKQFKTIAKYLAEKKIDDSYTKIAVTHHHLLPHPAPLNISGREIRMDLSIIRDSGLVEYKLENLGFDLILHGHKHNPQLRETLVRDKYNSKHTKKLIVCGAGSCGVNASELEHNQSNHYQVLELLNLPRMKDMAFFKLIWRELEVNDSAEWHTSMNWIISG